MPFLDSFDGEWVQTQLAAITTQANKSGRYNKPITQADLFRPGSDELRAAIGKLQDFLNFCRPLVHRSQVEANFSEGTPYMELVIWGTPQDLDRLKERATLLGLPGPRFAGGKTAIGVTI